MTPVLLAALMALPTAGPLEPAGTARRIVQPAPIVVGAVTPTRVANAKALYREAFRYHGKRQFDLAIENARAALRDAPSQFYALGLGLILKDSGDLDGAFEVWLQGLALPASSDEQGLRRELDALGRGDTRRWWFRAVVTPPGAVVEGVDPPGPIRADRRVGVVGERLVVRVSAPRHTTTTVVLTPQMAVGTEREISLTLQPLTAGRGVGGYLARVGAQPYPEDRRLENALLYTAAGFAAAGIGLGIGSLVALDEANTLAQPAAHGLDAATRATRYHAQATLHEGLGWAAVGALAVGLGLATAGAAMYASGDGRPDGVRLYYVGGAGHWGVAASAAF